MYICCKCSVTSQTINGLIDHMKFIHLLSSNATIECKQHRCGQLFSNFKSFKSHLKRVHKNIDTSQVNEECSFQENNETNVIEFHTAEDTNVPLYQNNLGNNPAEILKTLKLNALEFTLQLYAKSTYPRKDVMIIQNLVQKLCSSAEYILRNLCNSAQLVDFKESLRCILEFFNDPFSEIKTEYRFFKVLKENGLYDFPTCCQVSSAVDFKVVKGNPTLAQSISTAYFLPICFQIKKFFELPNILRLTLENQERLLRSGNICNFVCGEVFINKKRQFQNKIVIPIFLYFDDYEINNPLGSHTCLVFAGYYFFPTIPQYLLSKLDFLFNYITAKSSDVKKFGYNVVLQQMLIDLKYLEEEGLVINTNDDSFQVYFILGLVLGDNLGLNGVLGYTTSFNSKRYCRVCRRVRGEMKRDSKEKFEYFRNLSNYHSDLRDNNCTESGIKHNSIFNNLQHFHVVENWAFDIMHDIFEGVCIQDICHVIMSFIDEKIITLDVINSRCKYFQYGEIEAGNMFPPLDMHRLKSFNLKMSASECWSFIHFLPLMLGDLIPRNNKGWTLLCILISIIDILLKPEISLQDLQVLETLLTKHHLRYIKLFGPTLKPKHHYLLHYATAIKKIGPLRYIWGFRLESKHKESKLYCQNINSRVNISSTLTTKAGLRFAKFLTDYKAGFDPEVDFGKGEIVDLTKTEFYEKMIVLNYINLLIS